MTHWLTGRNRYHSSYSFLWFSLGYFHSQSKNDSSTIISIHREKKNVLEFSTAHNSLTFKEGLERCPRIFLSEVFTGLAEKPAWRFSENMLNLYYGQAWGNAFVHDSDAYICGILLRLKLIVEGWDWELTYQKCDVTKLQLCCFQIKCNCIMGASSQMKCNSTETKLPLHYL